MKNAKDVKEELEKLELGSIEVVGTVNVWSNGKRLRLYTGQDKTAYYHTEATGYKKMVAILVEVDA